MRMADFKADERACCSFELSLPLGTLTHLAAVEQLTLQEVVLVALEIVIVGLFDESPVFQIAPASICDSQAGTSRSFRAALAAHRIKRGDRAAQPTDGTEVQVQLSVLVVVDVGLPGLQSSSKAFTKSLREGVSFCLLTGKIRSI